MESLGGSILLRLSKSLEDKNLSEELQDMARKPDFSAAREASGHPQSAGHPAEGRTPNTSSKTMRTTVKFRPLSFRALNAPVEVM